jgi:hypothetical protein
VVTKDQDLHHDLYILVGAAMETTSITQLGDTPNEKQYKLKNHSKFGYSHLIDLYVNKVYANFKVLKLQRDTY